jgi:hypothetical protein
LASAFNICFNLNCFHFKHWWITVLKCAKMNAGSSAQTRSLTVGSSQLEPHVKTTPGLVKAVCWLMVNVLAISPDNALHHINKFGLVRLLFRWVSTDPETFSIVYEEHTVNCRTLLCFIYMCFRSFFGTCVSDLKWQWNKHCMSKMKADIKLCTSLFNVVKIGVLGFDSQWGLGIFLFTTVSRMALGSTQPPMLWVLGVKWPGCETDHSPPSSAKVKNAWSYTSTPPICLHGVVLS